MLRPSAFPVFTSCITNFLEGKSEFRGERRGFVSKEIGIESGYHTPLIVSPNILQKKINEITDKASAIETTLFFL